MPWFHNLPIRRKLTLGNMAVSTISLLAACLGFITYELASFRAATRDHVNGVADLIGANCTEALTSQDAEAAGQTLRSLRVERHIVAACIFDQQGAILACYLRAGAPPAELARGARPPGHYVEHGGLSVHQPIRLHGQLLGTIYVHSDFNAFRERLKRYAGIVVLLLLGSTVVALLLSARLAGVISRPIVELARAARRVSANKDYAVRALRRGGDELGGLVDAFNQMLEHIERDQELEQQRLKAEESSRLKSQFLANMSHEIRTPMNAVIGMTELALETQLTAEQRDCLETVRASASSLLGLLNDILDFSKIEAGKLALSSVEFSPRAVLDETMKMLALPAHEKGLELVYEVDPSIPVCLRGDPARLRQILVNLVGNAIKFTERGEVSAAVRREGAYLRFEVRDSGMGIPPDQHRAVFEAFTQVDSGTARRHGGTGLGLAISARLVEMMGGRVWLESEVGVGSAFYFTLRLAEAPGEPERALDGLEGLDALVVDDNATNRRVLTASLRAWGVRAAAAASAQEALTLLPLVRPALVLVDAEMPALDGFTLVDRMRGQPVPAPAMVMMLSSSGCIRGAERCRGLGVAAHLVKPVSPWALQQAVTQALGLAGAPREAARSEEDAGAAEARWHILVAEDNPVNQKLLARLLDLRGHSYRMAANGRLAVEAFDHEAFDAVLMDIQMPEMDGFQTTAAIRDRERRRGSHIPIIALTAHAMSGDRERCLAAGMDAYVSKPIQPGELFGAVRRAIRNAVAAA